jgi:hypothetical protein
MNFFTLHDAEVIGLELDQCLDGGVFPPTAQFRYFASTERDCYHHDHYRF